MPQAQPEAARVSVRLAGSRLRWLQEDRESLEDLRLRVAAALRVDEGQLVLLQGGTPLERQVFVRVKVCDEHACS